ncbi:MAG: hypothetical protein ACKORJ_05090 [Bacteroidota bacterium]
MRIFLIILTCLLTGITAMSQELFPDRITGEWNGMLHLWKNGELQDSVVVQLTVRPLGGDTWQWEMHYKSAMRPMVKDYRIKLLNRAANTYITDEGNGIELEDYAFGDRMMSMFETHETWLTSTQELSGDHLIFQVTAGKKSRTLEEGVTNFSITSLQRAVLTKKPNSTPIKIP